MNKSNSPSRFYSLDVLRGVASLSVVLVHWEFFYILYSGQTSLVTDHQFLFSFLSWVNRFGGKPVELFFCISGFVFFFLYSDSIHQSNISLKKFTVLRLSRLYPLHLFTLLLVVAGQFYYEQLTNSYFAIANIDAKHFILNLFFASAWGFENGVSFNGPVWSVSIEVMLYAIFFIFCCYTPKKIVLLLLLSLIGHFLISKINFNLGKGMELFFLGGCALVIYEKILSTNDIYKITSWLNALTMLAWLFMLFFSLKIGMQTLKMFPVFFQKILFISTSFIVFPMTILCLALYESKKGSLGKNLSFLGDISYSTYLLHFPLQLATVIIWLKCGLNVEWLYSVWFLILFFLTLILLSTVSYRYFEMPVQKWLRIKFSSLK